MASVDRHERRQQRVRGAGASSVQASFGFNLTNVVPKAIKQTSVPSPRSRQPGTPGHITPPSAHSSARRHRGASVQRSISLKRRITPQANNATPQLGKRKRGSHNAHENDDDDGEPDDLSPEIDKEVRSIEKSRRVAGTVSPIHEELDDVADELSFVDEGTVGIRKFQGEASVLSEGAAEKTYVAGRIGSMSITSTTALVRRPRSTESQPTTPGVPLNGRPRLSASRFGLEFTTPNIALDGDESEDELTPPQINDTTPRVVGRAEMIPSTADGEAEMDEISSLVLPSSVRRSPQPRLSERRIRPSGTHPKHEHTASLPVGRGRSKRVIIDDEDEAQPTSADRNPRPRGPNSNTLDQIQDNDLPDEISPETDRTRQCSANAKQMDTKLREMQVVEVSSGEDSDAYEPEMEDPSMIRGPPRQAPTQKSAKPVSSGTSRKRHKLSRPKQAISVMRIKGSVVRGITVADTTRTILEESLDYQVSRMAEKMQNARDSTRRKQVRGEINLALAFKESLSEKLLDLQDANDTLSAGYKKKRSFKTSNIEMRKDILALQNNRQEVAVHMDDDQVRFDAEKQTMDAKNELSAQIFGIQAAIQSGRERAITQSREDEGPEVPLSMLLDSVGEGVGSVGGGLLVSVRGFNSGLERAACWLEGRA